MVRVKREDLLCSKYNLVNQFLKIQGVGQGEREDLRQEVFVKALRSLGQLNRDDKMDGWLWAITENVTRAHLGRKKRDEARSAIFDEEIIGLKAKEMEAQEYNRMLLEINRLATRDTLSRALADLEPSVIKIFQLRYYLGYSLKDIASFYGVNYNTIKSIHSRGLKKLELLLREEERSFSYG